MKRYVIAIILTLLLACNAWPAAYRGYTGNFMDKGLSGYNVLAYGADNTGAADSRSAINDAHTAATVSGGIIIFPAGSYKISSGLTFNSDTTLYFHNGAELAIDTGVTVTINGKLSMVSHKIFDLTGTGVVVLAANSCDYILPQWWGAIGDDSTDCHDAIEAAITAAASVRHIYLQPGTYQVTSPIDNWPVSYGSDWSKGYTFRGAGTAATVLKYTGVSDFGIKVFNPTMETLTDQRSVNYTTVKDMRVQAPNTGAGGGGGIYMTGLHNTIHNIAMDDIDDTNGVGLKIEDAPYNITEDGMTNDADFDFTTTGAGASEKYAIAFTTDSNINVHVKSFTVRLGKTGAPAGTMVAEIYTDSSGPNTLVGSASEAITLTTLSADADGADQEFIFLFDNRAEIATATKYWIVLTTTGYTYNDGVTEVRLRADTGGGAANTFGTFTWGGAWATTADGANFTMLSTRNWALWNYASRLEISNVAGNKCFRAIEMRDNAQLHIALSSLDAFTAIWGDGGINIWVTGTNIDGVSTTAKPMDFSGVGRVGGARFSQCYFEGGSAKGGSFPIDMGGFFRVAFNECEVRSIVAWNPGTQVDFNSCFGPLYGTDDDEMQPAYNRRRMIYTPNRADGTRSISFGGATATAADADALTGTSWDVGVHNDLLDLLVGNQISNDYTLLPLGVYVATVYAKAPGGNNQLIMQAFEGNAGGPNLVTETFIVAATYQPYSVVIPWVTAETVMMVRLFASGSNGMEFSHVTLDYLGPNMPHQRDYLAFNTVGSDADGARQSKIAWQGIQSGDEQSYLATITGSHDGAADDEKGKLEISINDANDAFNPTTQMTIDSVDVTLHRGILALPETTTPTPVASEGRVYTKADDELYFQDGSGVEHTVLTGATGIEHTFVDPREDPTGTVGNWDIVQIGTSQSVHFNFQVPEDFETLDAVKVVVIPDATETIQWDILVSVAANGEAHDNDDRTALNETQAVTLNILTELSIAGVLTGLTAGDYVAVDFQSDTANIRVVGLEFDYN